MIIILRLLRNPNFQIFISNSNKNNKMEEIKLIMKMINLIKPTMKVSFKNRLVIYYHYSKIKFKLEKA